LKTCNQTLAIKYCIAIIAIIAIYFAISPFYLVELWHLKNCNYCNIFLRGFACNSKINICGREMTLLVKEREVRFLTANILFFYKRHEPMTVVRVKYIFSYLKRT
jgi:hypothetical protein